MAIDLETVKETYKTHKCGCKMRKDGFRWVMDTHCETHQPDTKKKADKFLKRKDRKRGKGFTKPEPTKKYLKERRKK